MNTLHEINHLDMPAGCHMDARNLGGQVFWNSATTGIDTNERHGTVGVDNLGKPVLAHRVLDCATTMKT